MDLTNVPVKKLKRSKSLDSLGETIDKGNESDEWEPNPVDDSGLQSHDGFLNLAKKVDKLNDMCMEQNRVLSELADHVRNSRKYAAFDDEQLMEVLGELLQTLLAQREKNEAGCVGDGGARSLLSAIEARPSLERRICKALTDYLQSEDLKKRIVSSITASIKDLIKNLFSMEVSSLYVPMMERAHRQLLKHVTKLVAAAFADLEERTACNVEVLRQTSQTLQTALKHHLALLQEACAGADRLVDAVTTTTEEVLDRELKQWREELSSAVPTASECDSGRVESPSPEPSCASSEQSVAAVSSSGRLLAVDRMMLTAEINKLVKHGDINGAFTKALLAMDLEMVVCACRAAAPALVAHTLPQVVPPQVVLPQVVPPQVVLPQVVLPQAVLLSLLQQLATDLVVETQLKCSYIEYALLNLNPADPVTRSNLPFVVSELDQHITMFFNKYPNHTMFHRISLIAVTARNLL